MQLIQPGKVLFLAVLFNGLFAFALSSQAARNGDQSGNIQYGPSIPIGNGFARAYIKYADSQLVEVDVSLTPGRPQGVFVAGSVRPEQVLRDACRREDIVARSVELPAQVRKVHVEQFPFPLAHLARDHHGLDV